MHRKLTPGTIAPPFSNYSHGVLTEANCRWLHISGQVGVGRDGRIPGDFAAQMELACINMLAVLREAQMELDDIVKITVFLVREEHVRPYREIRDRMLQGRAPASTLLVVKALARPELLVEIEAVAAKPTTVA
ncbi:MAG: RidA family protein [Geminicoccaceae bacterium]